MSMSRLAGATTLLLGLLLLATGHASSAATLERGASSGSSSSSSGGDGASVLYGGTSGGGGLRRQLQRFRQLWAAHPRADHNVTGSFRGEWAQLASELQPEDSAPLQRGSGGAVLKLRHAETSQGGVFGVEGRLVLRDGHYISHGDVMLSLQGVHVPAAGKLVAVAEPAHPIKLPAGLLLQQVQAAAGEGGSEEDREELLRAQVALLAAHPGAQAMEEGEEEDGSVVRHGRGGPSDPAEPASGWRRCAFVLELSVAEQPEPQPAEGYGQGHGDSQQRHGRSGSSSSSSRGSKGHNTRSKTGGAGKAIRRASRKLAPGGPAAQPPRPVDLLLQGTLSSQMCGVRLAVSLATARAEEVHSKAAQYTLMVAALGFAQVLLLVRQMESVTTPALAARISLLTLAHMAVLDAFLCLVHLTLGIMVESLAHSFGTVAFVQFVVFAIFEMRFLLSVWRARRGGVDPWTAQREVSVLYCRFYAALLAGILLTYQLQRYLPVLLFFYFSFWWPQIVLCIRCDARQPLKPEFILGSSAARLALPLYIFGCPSNLLSAAPNPVLCAGLVAWVGLQCALLLLQYYYGPRCCIPTLFLPVRYDYGRTVPEEHCCGSEGEEGGSTRECLICLGSVDLADKADRAVTPCCHVFHRACLERWTNVKPECPTCRHALPPL